MNEILQLSALEIASKIKNKDVKPSEVLEVHIERIESVNSRVNAVVENFYDQARETSLQYDQILMTKSAAELPVLFGVPFTIKEMLAVNEAKRTAGSVHRRNHVMNFDSSVVIRMKNAGAIPMGTTNVPELGFWFECANPVYGVTNNPFDLSRTSGGSSGGEAAIIASAGSPFGLGSDIGGSIRMPAAFCGVSGHKPSNRLVPITGHFPYFNEQLSKIKDPLYPLTSVGPIAKKASDLRLLLQLMMGPDQIDPETKQLTNSEFGTLSAREFDFSKLKVLVCSRPLFHLAAETDNEVAVGVEQTAKYFSELGATVEQFEPRLMTRAFDLWTAAVRKTKDSSFSEMLSPEEPLSFAKEFFNLATGKARYTFPSLVTSYLERFASEGESQDQLLFELEKLKAVMNEKLRGPVILLMPTHPRVAMKHGSPVFRPFDFIYTAIFNALGLPATTVPIGLNLLGLPLSVQIVSAWGQDGLCLSAAESIEAAFGGWTSPNL